MRPGRDPDRRVHSRAISDQVSAELRRPNPARPQKPTETRANREETADEIEEAGSVEPASSQSNNADKLGGRAEAQGRKRRRLRAAEHVEPGRAAGWPPLQSCDFRTMSPVSGHVLAK